MVPQMVPQRNRKTLVDLTEGVAMQQHGKTENNSEEPVPMKSRKAALSGNNNLLTIGTYKIVMNVTIYRQKRGSY